MLQNEDGTETTVPDTAPATVYVPKNSAYTLRSPDLYGYTCVGNSANQGEINITEDRQEITYYYRRNSEMPEIQTVPVRVTYDGKPHTFDIKQEDGVQISYSLTENGSYTQTEMPFYTEAGQYKIYFKAEKASFIPTYEMCALDGFIIVTVVRYKYNRKRPYEIFELHLIPKDTKGHSWPSRHVLPGR